MFGYADRQSPELMPLPISLAYGLTRRLAKVRKSGWLPWLRPDGKSQVTVLYENNHPQAVTTIVLSAQHAPSISHREIKPSLLEQVVSQVVPPELRSPDMQVHINPTGRFVTGGPAGDSGATGRKIIVDTYGGWSRHGGGAFCVAGDSIINTEHGLGKIKGLSFVKKGDLIKTDISPTPNWTMDS